MRPGVAAIFRDDGDREPTRARPAAAQPTARPVSASGSGRPAAASAATRPASASASGRAATSAALRSSTASAKTLTNGSSTFSTSRLAQTSGAPTSARTSSRGVHSASAGSIHAPASARATGSPVVPRTHRASASVSHGLAAPPPLKPSSSPVVPRGPRRATVAEPESPPSPKVVRRPASAASGPARGLSVDPDGADAAAAAAASSAAVPESPKTPKSIMRTWRATMRKGSDPSAGAAAAAAAAGLRHSVADLRAAVPASARPRASPEGYEAKMKAYQQSLRSSAAGSSLATMSLGRDNKQTRARAGAGAGAGRASGGGPSVSASVSSLHLSARGHTRALHEGLQLSFLDTSKPVPSQVVTKREDRSPFRRSISFERPPSSPAKRSSGARPASAAALLTSSGSGRSSGPEFTAGSRRSDFASPMPPRVSSADVGESPSGGGAGGGFGFGSARARASTASLSSSLVYSPGGPSLAAAAATPRKGHVYNVRAIVSVENRVWVGAGDSVIDVYNKRGRLVRRLNGHADVVNALLRVGEYIWSASYDRTIGIWSHEEDNEDKVRALQGHRAGVKCLALVYDTVWSGGRDGSVIVWRLSNQEKLREVHPSSRAINCMCVVRDRVIAASDDRCLYALDALSCATLHRLAIHTDYVNVVVPAADGRTFWAASDDHSISVWDSFTFKPLRTIAKHTKAVKALVDVQGRMVSGAVDGCVYVWDTQPPFELVRHLQRHQFGVNNLVLFDSCMVVAFVDRMLSVWDVQFTEHASHHVTIADVISAEAKEAEREAAEARARREAAAAERRRLQEEAEEEMRRRRALLEEEERRRRALLDEEERLQRLEEERLRRAEEERRRREEEEEEERKRREEEERRKRGEIERRHREAEEEERRRREEEEEQRRRREEEERRRREEEEEQKRREEEAERRRKAEEEERLRREEEERRRREEEERRRREEEEERVRLAEEERRRREAAEERLRLEEEAERLRLEEEEAEAERKRRRAAAEEEARLKREAEERKKRAEEEERRRREEEEGRRREEEERKRREEEERKRREEEERRRREEEERKRREEEERKRREEEERLRREEEERRRREEEERKRREEEERIRKAEEERRRREEEEEIQRGKREAEEAARIRREAEERAERERLEAEQARLEAERLALLDRDEADELNEELAPVVDYLNAVLGPVPRLAHALPLPRRCRHFSRAIAEGALLAVLVNIAYPGTIDDRVIAFGPEERSEEQRRFNLALAVRAAAACGMPVAPSLADEVADGDYRSAYKLAWLLAEGCVYAGVERLRMKAFVAELLEEGENPGSIPADALLFRWLRRELKEALCTRQVENLGEDFADGDVLGRLIRHLDLPCYAANAAELSSPEAAARARGAVAAATAYAGKPPLASPEDILRGAPLLTASLLVDLFVASAHRAGRRGPALPAPPRARSLRSVDPAEAEDREERALRAWINGLGLAVPPLTYLFFDARTGLVFLHVMDRLVPGSVEWRKVNKSPERPWQKAENCNYALSVAKDKIRIEVVAMGGTDIADGVRKFILAVGWQLRRYHLFNFLKSVRGGGGEDLTEADLIKWANARVREMERDGRPAPQIASFREKSLKNGLWLAYLLEAVYPGTVVLSLLVTGSDAPADCEANARLVVSSAWRAHIEAMILWEDIVEVNARLLLTFVAAVYQCGARRGGRTSIPSTPAALPPRSFLEDQWPPTPTPGTPLPVAGGSGSP